MIKTSIATAVRTAGVAVLAGVAALGLAIGTAHAAPGTPDPPSGAGRLYGDPAAAAPYWHYQKYDDDCVEMAVADVVGQVTGHALTEQAIVSVAQSTPSTVHSGPIYNKPGKRKAGDGTYFDDEPTLLAHYGIRAVSTDKSSTPPTSLEAIEQDLEAGRKVIVGANSEVLWGDPVVDKTPSGKPDSNHAVVVTGIDTRAGIVHLNDSGSEDGRDEQVTLAVFIRSWASSDNQMTVTS
jgi:uncharacterized protein YvpB